MALEDVDESSNANKSEKAGFESQLCVLMGSTHRTLRMVLRNVLI